MEFILAAFGTTGDINPYVALGLALKKRGYKVKFLANGFFKDLVEKQGLHFVEVGTASDFLKIVGHRSFFHPRKAFNFVSRHMIIGNMRKYYNAVLQEVNSRSIIISQSFGPALRIIHEKYSIPYISVNLQPFSFWSFKHPPVYPGFKFPENIPLTLKRRVLQIVNKFYIDPKFASGINPFLKELGLPVYKNYFSEWLYSPQMVIGAFPAWFAQPSEDWPAHTHLTGFIAMNEQNELNSEIQGFLSMGKPPLIFTFGSSMKGTGSLFKAAIKVTKYLKMRAIFITSNPAAINPDPGSDFLITGYVPFRSLFPYAEAIIHHGGIGTIAHALAAGKPQLMVPFAHDQPDNAYRAAKLGVGLTLSPKEFMKDVMKLKLKYLLESESIRLRCSKYSAMINFEESIENMVNSIENFVSANKS